MKPVAILALCLLCAACGSKPAEPEATRPRHDPMPLQNVRDARDAETTALLATIHRQILVASQRATDRDAFLRSMNGPMNAEKLQRIGMTEAQLANARFRVEHYSVHTSDGRLELVADNGAGIRTSASYELR
jgi:hypothetical protein